MTNTFDEFSMNSKLNIYYTSCKASENLSDKISELLKGILKPNKKEQIILSIYHSLHCWLKTIVTLNHTIHVQAIASGTRAIYEQLLDLKLVVDDKIRNVAERFEAFREIEKFRMAKKLADFKKTHPDVKTRPHETRVQYALNKNNQAKVQELRKKWFGGIEGRIEHWSGLNIADRAKKAGVSYEVLYSESFIIWSWFAHSGQVGNTTKEFLELVYGDSLRLVHEMFVDAILLTARAFKLNIAIVGFDDWMQQLKLVPGFAILEEEKKYLESLKQPK